VASDDDITRKVTTKRRRCPNCGSMVDWRNPKHPKKPRDPWSTVICRREVVCGWQGPIYETLPVSRHARRSLSLAPDFYRDMLRVLQDAFDKQLSSRSALRDFEVYLQNHPLADPDQRGHDTLDRYLRVLGQLWMLAQLFEQLGLNDYKDDILRQEILFLFPESTGKPRLITLAR